MRPFVSNWALPISLALVALTASGLLFFAGPAADDFCRGTKFELTEHLTHSYMTHTGRWASVGFLAPLILQRIDLFSPIQYGALLLLFWCGYFAVLYFIIRLMVDRTTRTSICFKGTLLIGVVWWCGLPAPGQTAYWASGGLEYGLGFQALVILIAAVVLFTVRERSNLLVFLILAVCTLFVTGLHEIIALCVVFALIVIAAIAFVERVKNRVALLALAGVGTIGAALSIFAPGNAVRAAKLVATETPGSPLYAIYIDWYGHLVPWFIDPKLLCVSFLMLTSKDFAELKPRWPATILKFWLVIPICSLALVSGCLLVPIIVLGQPGPGRLHNFAYSIFIVGWFLMVFVGGKKFTPHPAPNFRVLREFVALLFMIAILFTGNTERAVSAVIGRNNIFSWHTWLQKIGMGATQASQQGAGELSLIRITTGPEIYTAGFQRTPDRDPEHFINRCMADYLGLSKILVKDVGQGEGE